MLSSSMAAALYGKFLVRLSVKLADIGTPEMFAVTVRPKDVEGIANRVNPDRF